MNDRNEVKTQAEQWVPCRILHWWLIEAHYGMDSPSKIGRETEAEVGIAQEATKAYSISTSLISS